MVRIGPAQTRVLQLVKGIRLIKVARVLHLCEKIDGVLHITADFTVKLLTRADNNRESDSKSKKLDREERAKLVLESVIFR